VQLIAINNPVTHEAVRAEYAHWLAQAVSYNTAYTSRSISFPARRLSSEHDEPMKAMRTHPLVSTVMIEFFAVGINLSSSAAVLVAYLSQGLHRLRVLAHITRVKIAQLDPGAGQFTSLTAAEFSALYEGRYPTIGHLDGLWATQESVAEGKPLLDWIS
jgi:hypothetical protein